MVLSLIFNAVCQSVSFTNQASVYQSLCDMDSKATRFDELKLRILSGLSNDGAIVNCSA